MTVSKSSQSSSSSQRLNDTGSNPTQNERINTTSLSNAAVKISTLMSQVHESAVCSPEVESFILSMAHDFIDNVAAFSGKIAKHRGSRTLEAQDIRVCLEKNYAMFPHAGKAAVRQASITHVLPHTHLDKLSLVSLSSGPGGSTSSYAAGGNSSSSNNHHNTLHQQRLLLKKRMIDKLSKASKASTSLSNHPPSGGTSTSLGRASNEPSMTVKKKKRKKEPPLVASSSQTSRDDKDKTTLTTMASTSTKSSVSTKSSSHQLPASSRDMSKAI